MALEVYWYDFVCFGIVGFSLLGALWVIWRREGASARFEDTTMYESLLVTRPDSEVFVSALPRGHVSTSQLWTSCWKGLHPGWLLAIRFLSFLALAGFLTWDIVEWDASIFIYYTEWTFTLVMVYFALGTIVSAYGWWLSANKPPSENGTRAESLRTDVEGDNGTVNTYRQKGINGTIKLQSHYAQEEIQHRAGFWGYLMLIAFQTCAGAVVLTDIVFWCVILPFLSNAHLGLNTLMCCMHTLNAAFLLLDTSLNSLPFPWFRLSYFVLWSCLYVIFQWVIHAFGFPWWPYPFLELDTPWAPLWYFCMAVVHIPCYGIFALIIKAKYSLLPKWFPHAFICAGAVMLTDIVFSCLILPFLTSMEFELTLLIAAIHAVNAVFLIGDTTLNKLPIPELGFAYFALFGFLYIVFQWLLHACCIKWWPYPFLVLNTPWAPLWYFGLAEWHIPCFWIYSLIVKAKFSILPRLFPGTFVRF